MGYIYTLVIKGNEISTWNAFQVIYIIYIDSTLINECNKLYFYLKESFSPFL